MKAFRTKPIHPKVKLHKNFDFEGRMPIYGLILPNVPEDA